MMERSMLPAGIEPTADRLQIVESVQKICDQYDDNFWLKKDQNKIYQLIQNDKTQKEINALLEKYTKETLRHLNKLKHHACYNEMLELINFSKIRKI